MSQPPSPHERTLDFLNDISKRIGAKGFVLHFALEGSSVTVTKGSLKGHRERIRRAVREHEDGPMERLTQDNGDLL